MRKDANYLKNRTDYILVIENKGVCLCMSDDLVIVENWTEVSPAITVWRMMKYNKSFTKENSYVSVDIGYQKPDWH